MITNKEAAQFLLRFKKWRTGKQFDRPTHGDINDSLDIAIHELQQPPKMPNCLSYALRFWNKNPDYKLYYNSDHIINSNTVLPPNTGFHPIESFGLSHILESFAETISDQDNNLLNQYFNHEKNNATY